MFMTPSGVECKDLSRGSGEPARPGDRVVVHYTGWLADGTQFDSSQGGEPFASHFPRRAAGGILKGRP